MCVYNAQTYLLQWGSDQIRPYKEAYLYCKLAATVHGVCCVCCTVYGVLRLLQL